MHELIKTNNFSYLMLREKLAEEEGKEEKGKGGI